MSRPRILITPAIFLSASIAAGSYVDEAHEAPATDAPLPGSRRVESSASPGNYGILARLAHVCHTR